MEDGEAFCHLEIVVRTCCAAKGFTRTVFLILRVSVYVCVCARARVSTSARVERTVEGRYFPNFRGYYRPCLEMT